MDGKVYRKVEVKAGKVQQGQPLVLYTHAAHIICCCFFSFSVCAIQNEDSVVQVKEKCLNLQLLEVSLYLALTGPAWLYMNKPEKEVTKIKVC